MLESLETHIDDQHGQDYDNTFVKGHVSGVTATIGYF